MTTSNHTIECNHTLSTPLPIQCNNDNNSDLWSKSPLTYDFLKQHMISRQLDYSRSIEFILYITVIQNQYYYYK